MTRVKMGGWAGGGGMFSQVGGGGRAGRGWGSRRKVGGDGGGCSGSGGAAVAPPLASAHAQPSWPSWPWWATETRARGTRARGRPRAGVGGDETAAADPRRDPFGFLVLARSRSLGLCPPASSPPPPPPRHHRALPSPALSPPRPPFPHPLLPPPSHPTFHCRSRGWEFGGHHACACPGRGRLCASRQDRIPPARLLPRPPPIPPIRTVNTYGS